MEVAIYRREIGEAQILPASEEERMKLLATEAEKTAHMINADLAEKAGFKSQAGKYRHQAALAERRLQPAPQFPEVRFNELMIWIQFLPVVHWDLNFAHYEGVVPPEVMKVMAECRERKTFDDMEIRTDSNSHDHALFGRTFDGGCAKRYLVARWCEDKLVSFKEICGILSARKTNAAHLKRRSFGNYFVFFVASISAFAIIWIFKGSHIWGVSAGISAAVFLILSACSGYGFINAAKEAKKLEAYAKTL